MPGENAGPMPMRSASRVRSRSVFGRGGGLRAGGGAGGETYGARLAFGTRLHVVLLAHQHLGDDDLRVAVDGDLGVIALQFGERVEVTPPELADRAMIRRLHRRHRHEIDPLGACPGDLPRREHPLRVRVQQQRRHHHRVIRRIPALLLVHADDRRQVELLAHQLPKEVRHVPLRHQLSHRRWQ